MGNMNPIFYSSRQKYFFPREVREKVFSLGGHRKGASMFPMFPSDE